MKCGFIGLGIMGQAMALNLIPHLGKEMEELYVFNRTSEKADPLVQKGARFAESPQSLGRHVDVVMTMLSRPEVVKDVALGEAGFLNHFPSGAVWIDFSTVGPKTSRELAAICREKGIRYYDCPVGGSKAPAEEGSLALFLGATESEWKSLSKELGFLFDSLGSKTIPCGGVGRASALKMVVNMQLGVACAAFSEALSFGEGLGFEREKLLEVFSEHPVVAPFLGLKKEKFLHSSYEAEFPLEWMQKDLDLVLESSHESEGFMPISSLVNELYALAKKEGFSREDFSAIRKIYY